MSKEKEMFLELGLKLENSVQGQLFGKPCFKVNGKAYICFFEDEMVFKLTGDAHSDALSLDGTQLFDPSKKNRPMKEWVQVPYDYSVRWEEFALEALRYVDSISKK